LIKKIKADEARQQIMLFKSIHLCRIKINSNNKKNYDKIFFVNFDFFVVRRFFPTLLTGFFDLRSYSSIKDKD